MALCGSRVAQPKGLVSLPCNKPGGCFLPAKIAFMSMPLRALSAQSLGNDLRLVTAASLSRGNKRAVLANVPSFPVFWCRGTSEGTPVPVWVPGEHPPKPPFCKPPSLRGKFGQKLWGSFYQGSLHKGGFEFRWVFLVERFGIGFR